MLDITAIVLTYNEGIHIRRCLDRALAYAARVVVVDSFSTDRTVEIARSYGRVSVLQHKWENNYARQFNWGLDHADIRTAWTLRLDADEYLLPELVKELEQQLPQLPSDVTGVAMNRRHIFMDRWMRRGTYPVTLLRLFRTGQGRCEERLMDEHIQLTTGRTVTAHGDFCDHNLNNLSWFCHKHVDYAVREAVDLLDIELGLTGAAATDAEKQISRQAQAKRMKKHRYARLPLFWRAAAYFAYRYFLRGACLEGKAGFLWTFLQGWWYRTLVDAKVWEIKRTCGTDSERIIDYVQTRYHIAIRPENIGGGQ